MFLVCGPIVTDAIAEIKTNPKKKIEGDVSELGKEITLLKLSIAKDIDVV